MARYNSLSCSARFSAGIFRRQLGAEIVDLIDVCCRENTLLWFKEWSNTYPRMTAYNQAVYRLRRRGVVARRDRKGGPPKLELTDEGRQNVSLEIVPELFWNKRWDGRWYVLMYDVPERERRYRDALSRFLKRNRMGLLQKSVFISACDIRPMFYDLDIAAAIAEYANLFEFRTVAGQENMAIVLRAWDFDRLHKNQSAYIKECAARGRQPARAISFHEVLAAMRAELAEYLHAMSGDPLLPKPLWPQDYLGPRATAEFRRRIRCLAGQIAVRAR